jgi:NADH-quinone oxidoreductase subunit E
MLTDEERREINEMIKQYEYKRGACIDAMKIVQRRRGGWISDQSLKDVADFLDMTADELHDIQKTRRQASDLCLRRLQLLGARMR